MCTPNRAQSKTITPRALRPASSSRQVAASPNPPDHHHRRRTNRCYSVPKHNYGAMRCAYCALRGVFRPMRAYGSLLVCTHLSNHSVQTSSFTLPFRSMAVFTAFTSSILYRFRACFSASSSEIPWCFIINGTISSSGLPVALPNSLTDSEYVILFLSSTNTSLSKDESHFKLSMWAWHHWYASTSAYTSCQFMIDARLSRKSLLFEVLLLIPCYLKV